MIVPVLAADPGSPPNPSLSLLCVTAGATWYAILVLGALMPAKWSGALARWAFAARARRHIEKELRLSDTHRAYRELLAIHIRDKGQTVWTCIVVVPPVLIVLMLLVAGNFFAAQATNSRKLSGAIILVVTLGSYVVALLCITARQVRSFSDDAVVLAACHLRRLTFREPRSEGWRRTAAMADQLEFLEARLHVFFSQRVGATDQQTGSVWRATWAGAVSLVRMSKATLVDDQNSVNSQCGQLAEAVMSSVALGTWSCLPRADPALVAGIDRRLKPRLWRFAVGVSLLVAGCAGALKVSEEAFRPVISSGIAIVTLGTAGLALGKRDVLGALVASASGSTRRESPGTTTTGGSS